MMKDIQLFDYQEDMVKRVQEAFKHHDSVMVQMPTGTGKTMVLANIVFSFLEKSNHPIWIVAHRRELVSQIKETIFSKITPSLFTLKEGSTSHPDPLTLRGEGGNRPTRCSEPLRSKDGGPSKVSPDCAGWDRLGATCLRPADRVADDEIEVLVSVDLFSEGFDCPDVEFIQLARPTLSLAKYMQMVGRGLRVAEGKEYCVILDNVGLYKRFGLPSVDRDWLSMFEGSTSLEDILQEACMQVYNHNCRMDLMMDGDEEMMKIINHERQQQMIMDTYGYEIVEDEKGLKGIKDKDGKKLYPRILSKYIDEKTYLTVKTLELQVGTGLSWKHRFDNICVINNTYLIEKSEPDQWYKICRRTDDFSYFSVLACYYESELIMDDTEIQITQFDGEGLKMTQEGYLYTPLVIKTHKRKKWL